MAEHPARRSAGTSRPPRILARSRFRKKREGDDARSFAGSLRFSGFSLLMLGLIVMAVLMLAPGLKNFFEQRQQIADLEAQVHSHQQQLDRLKEQRDRWSDPVYVRAQVRERLSFVMPGEVSLLVIDDVSQPSAEATTKVSEELQTTEVDWEQQLLRSVAYAGLGNPEPEELQIAGPR